MKQKNMLPPGLSKPAQRALANAGITSLQQLATFTEKQIAALHGVGNHALVKIREAFKEHGLEFAKQ